MKNSILLRLFVPLQRQQPRALILMLLTFVTLSGSLRGAIYDFENVTNNATTFSSSGQTWSLTGFMRAIIAANFGSPLTGNASPTTNGYMDTLVSTPRSLGNVGGITAPVGYTFRAKSFDVWPSSSTGSNIYGGTNDTLGTTGLNYQVIGKLGGSIVATANVTDTVRSPAQSGTAVGGYWHHLELGAGFAAVDIDAVEFVLVSQTGAAMDYLAVDNFEYSNLGVAAPEIAVTESAANVADGGSLGFGTTTVGTPVTKTFTVTNSGTAVLNLSALSVPSGFTIAQNFASATVASGGGTTTFQITMSAGAAATPSGTLSFTNNDSDENPYNFTISGTVNAALPSRALFYIDSDAAKEDILRVSPDGSGNTPVVVVDAVGGIFANVLEIDDLGGRLFWWENESDKIYRSNLDGTGITTLVSLTSAAVIQDLAYDPVADELYFINSDAAVESILKVDASGSNETPVTVVNSANIGGQFANHLSIDTAGRRLFWFENETDAIYRSAIDGTGRVVLVSFTAAALIQDIEYDPVNNELYFIDSDNTKDDILKVSANGTNNTPVLVVDDLGGTFANSMAVDVAANQIFWWENATDIIYRSDLTGAGRVSLSVLTAAASVTDIELFIPPAPLSGSPEIAVSETVAGNVADGGSFSFGTTTVGTPVTKTFTITNSGTAALTLSNLTPPSGFAIAQNFGATTVAASGGQTTFQILMTAGAPAPPSGTLTFDTNDSDENPFNFTISGTIVGSNNADLSALTTTATGLTPAFGAATTTYNATVPNGTTSTTVTATRA
ncbi:MAG: choice-of-anchor D domain-containing protein, partial [Verrucomicrobiales bacterium]|nr:choice-of-anchor D domain-containing protein [Verrucomicrobiales bacterium]